MTDHIIDLVGSLACAARALKIARDGEARFRGVPHGDFNYSSVLHGLIKQVQFNEARLVAAIDAAGGEVFDRLGDVLTVGVNDRRKFVRPAFQIHRPDARDLQERRRS
jgi:hypothetical protein